MFFHSRGEKKRNHEHVSSINVYEKKHQKSFHKGWFIPNEVLQRILFTWLPKLSSFPKSGLPPIKWQCVKLIVPEVCEGDIPCYYLLFPNRLFYPFVDQLHCKFTVRYYTYTVQMIVERPFVPFSATHKSQNTPSKCMKLKNNHSKHCSSETAFNSKLPADDSISPFKPRTTDVHVIPGLMLIMLYLSRQIFWWFTALLPKSADHIDERHLARLPLASLLSFLSNRSYTCQLANRHLMLYGFSIFPNSERGQTWKQPNVKACSLRTVWEVYGYSMVFIENR